MKNPQEEPKQETLEDAAERTYQKGLQDDIDLSFYDGVRLGAKWQAEKMYSEEEVKQIIFKFTNDFDMKKNIEITSEEQSKWFEQFRKKSSNN
jgi:hypothetical protein